MDKITINFKGTEDLSQLIGIMSARMKKNRSEFITFAVEQIVKAYDQNQYELYESGEMGIIEESE